MLHIIINKTYLSPTSHWVWNKDYERDKCTVLKEHTKLGGKRWEMDGEAEGEEKFSGEKNI